MCWRINLCRTCSWLLCPNIFYSNFKSFHAACRSLRHCISRKGVWVFLSLRSHFAKLKDDEFPMLPNEIQLHDTNPMMRFTCSSWDSFQARHGLTRWKYSCRKNRNSRVFMANCRLLLETERRKKDLLFAVRCLYLQQRYQQILGVKGSSVRKLSSLTTVVFVNRAWRVWFLIIRMDSFATTVDEEEALLNIQRKGEVSTDTVQIANFSETDETVLLEDGGFVGNSNRGDEGLLEGVAVGNIDVYSSDSDEEEVRALLHWFCHDHSRVTVTITPTDNCNIEGI